MSESANFERGLLSFTIPPSILDRANETIE